MNRYLAPLLLIAGAVALACIPVSDAKATAPHSRVSVDPVLYELVWEKVWYPGGYDHYGRYLPGYYYWVQRYRAVKVERVSYSLSFDAEKGGIIEAIDRLGKRVDALGGAKGLVAGDGLAVLRRECASCHGAKVADQSGDGFVLLDADGGLMAMGKGAAKRVTSRVGTTDAAIRMPPGKQLSSEDRAAIRRLMEGLGAAKE